MDSLPLLVVLAVSLISAVVSAAEFKVVCYYTNWAQYRKAKGAGFFPEDVDPQICTHIIFSFAYLKDNGRAMGEREWNDLDTEFSPGMYTRFNDLKKKNPKLKTLLAVGGWNHPADLFTKGVATDQSRSVLNKQIISFLREHNFDGFDLDWEYPGNRGSPGGDKQKFSLWCKSLRSAFEAEAKSSGKERLLLTAAVGAGKNTVDNAYEIGKIAQSLDFINLMAYDLHGSWEKSVNNHSPLKARSSEKGAQATLNVEWAANYWLKDIKAAGEPSSKLILGLPTYGRSFKLANPSSSNGPTAPATDPGTAGPYTGEKGFLAYFEICDLMNKGAVNKWDEEQRYPYAYKGDQWVGYDDMKSLKEKVDLIKDAGMGGAMFWTLDLDDFTGKHCNQGKYPLINFVAQSLNGKNPKVEVLVGNGKEEGGGGGGSTGGGSSGGNGNGNGGNGNGGNGNGGNGNGGNGGTKPVGANNCEKPGVFPNPDDCFTYIHCANGITYVKACPSGLMFSSTASACVWPQQSDCKK